MGDSHFNYLCNSLYAGIILQETGLLFEPRQGTGNTPNLIVQLAVGSHEAHRAGCQDLEL